MLHKDRTSTLFIGPGDLSVHNGGLTFSNKEGQVSIPVGQFSCIFLEPGTSVSHEAIKVCAETGCLLNWVGESGVRFYASGISNVARTDRLWCQAEQALNKNKRLAVARRMYAYRFGNGSALGSYSLEQLSGLEAGRVKKIYQELAEKNSLVWEGRSLITTDSSMKSRVNLCVSTANSCLYGLAHAAIVAAGYTPSMGFIHGRTAQSFVYDVADLVKFQKVTPIAFEVGADLSVSNPSRETRIRCRDLFKSMSLVDMLIPLMDSVIGYQQGEEVERPALLPTFEVWPYASSIVKECPPLVVRRFFLPTCISFVIICMEVMLQKEFWSTYYRSCPGT